MFSVTPLSATLIQEADHFEVGKTYNVSCAVVGSNPVPDFKISVGPKILKQINYYVSEIFLFLNTWPKDEEQQVWSKTSGLDFTWI